MKKVNIVSFEKNSHLSKKESEDTDEIERVDEFFLIYLLFFFWKSQENNKENLIYSFAFFNFEMLWDIHRQR